MSVTNPNLVKYQGIVKSTTLHTSSVKQCNKSNIFFIPANAPKVHELLEVSATVSPSQHEIITSPSGNKVSLIGTIQLKFQFISNDDAFYIRSLTTQYSFCDYIALPSLPDTKGLKPSTFEIKPKILIEDIFAHILAPQCIYHNLTLLLCINFY